MKQEIVDAVISAIKARAVAYFYLFTEMEQEFGHEKAVSVFKNAIYKMGKEKAAKKYSKEAEKSAVILCDEFVEKDEIHKEVFNKKSISALENECTLEMHRCPLVEAWKEMDLSEERISLLCDLAYQVDFGTFETLGYKLTFLKRCADGNDRCQLYLKREEV